MRIINMMWSWEINGLAVNIPEGSDVDLHQFCGQSYPGREGEDQG